MVWTAFLINMMVWTAFLINMMVWTAFWADNILNFHKFHPAGDSEFNLSQLSLALSTEVSLDTKLLLTLDVFLHYYFKNRVTLWNSSYQFSKEIRCCSLFDFKQGSRWKGCLWYQIESKHRPSLKLFMECFEILQQTKSFYLTFRASRLPRISFWVLVTHGFRKFPSDWVCGSQI